SARLGSTYARGLALVLLTLAAVLLFVARAQAAPPGNDLPANAESIPDGPFPARSSTTADITGATTTDDPPAPSCQGSVSRSVWFKFTPSQTASYRISDAADGPTSTTVDDTILAAYTSPGGSSAGPFTELPTAGDQDGCDDDSAVTEALQSQLRTRLDAGTTYYFVVSQFGTAVPTTGNTAVQLLVDKVSQPANDLADGAAPLRLNRPVTGDATLAADNYTLSGAGCFNGPGQTASTAPGRDEVYRFVAPSTDTYRFRVQSLDGSNAVLYVASSLPTGAGPADVPDCLRAANRTTGATAISEQAAPVALIEGQVAYVVVDYATAGTGGRFDLVAERDRTESEPNDTPATAGPRSCGLGGSINPAGQADFLSLGSTAAGARVFALADGGSSMSGDFDMRATTATDTLEYDDTNADVPFGLVAPVIAGTPLPGGDAYLRLSMFTATLVGDPYRLYSVVQPPIAQATPETEPNGTPAAANDSPIDYVSGTLAGPGPSSDVDVYRFAAPAGSVVFLGLDGDPLRDATPLNGRLELLDSTGTRILGVNDNGAISNTTASPGTLTGTTPTAPAEGLAVRVPDSGTFFARVSGGATTPTAGSGDYLLSIAVDCQPGAASLMAISPATLPAATAGTAYSADLSASGGTAPYHFAVESGDLPLGVALSPTGTLSGTPTTPGDYAFRVTATDARDLSVSRDYTLTVAAAAAPGGGGTGGDGGGTPGSGIPGGGTPGGGGGDTTVDTTAPAFAAVSLTNKTFKVGSAKTPQSAAAKTGTAFRYSLSEAATVTIAFDLKTTGKRDAKGRCVKPTRKLRKAKNCTRYVAAGSLVRHGQGPGAVTTPFSGRIAKHALARGTYRATLTARDAAGNASAPKQLSFKIVAR
ncbi:MAG: hypothetical protein QOJ07_1198, partial [Thermoleophilaceae bacterium]|nr:hypothetical protein [Thermoleophilaceae bacterium]